MLPVHFQWLNIGRCQNPLLKLRLVSIKAPLWLVTRSTSSGKAGSVPCGRGCRQSLLEIHLPWEPAAPGSVLGNIIAVNALLKDWFCMRSLCKQSLGTKWSIFISMHNANAICHADGRCHDSLCLTVTWAVSWGENAHSAPIGTSLGEFWLNASGWEKNIEQHSLSMEGGHEDHWVQFYAESLILVFQRKVLISFASSKLFYSWGNRSTHGVLVLMTEFSCITLDLHLADEDACQFPQCPELLGVSHRLSELTGCWQCN